MDKNFQKAAKYKKIFVYSLIVPLALFALQLVLAVVSIPPEILTVVFSVFTLIFSLGLIVALVFLVMWLAALIANQAAQKGRSWKNFFILSLFFPFIMWIVVSVITTDQSQPVSGTKTCPNCAEYVKSEATLCKHCGSSI